MGPNVQPIRKLFSMEDMNLSVYQIFPLKILQQNRKVSCISNDSEFTAGVIQCQIGLSMTHPTKCELEQNFSDIKHTNKPIIRCMNFSS